MKDPAFLFYYRDFMCGTAYMSNSARGAYIQLMCLQAENGHVTDVDMKKICSNICYNTMSIVMDNDTYNAVKSKFVETETGSGTYVNARLTEEIQKRVKYSESRRNNRKSKSEITHDDTYVKTYVKHMVNVNENENINRNKEGVQGEKKQTSSTSSALITEIESRLHHTEIHDKLGRFVSSKTSDIRALISPDMDRVEFEKMAMRDSHRWEYLMQIYEQYCDTYVLTGEPLTRKEALKKMHDKSFYAPKEKLPVNKVNGNHTTTRKGIVYQEQ